MFLRRSWRPSCRMSDLLKARPKIQVLRNGEIFASFSAEDFLRAQDVGDLRASDLCREEGSGDEYSLKEMVDFVKRPGYLRTAPNVTFRSPDQSLAGKRKRPVVLTLAAMLGVALIVAVGIASWAIHLQHRNHDLAQQIRSMRTGEQKVEKNRISNGLLPPDEISGFVVLRGHAGGRAPGAGLGVKLYPRDQIEKHIAERTRKLDEDGVAPPTQADMAAHYTTDLPEPIETIYSGSNGTFRFQLPEPGEYVVHLSILDSETRRQDVWFVGVNSADQMNTPVELSEQSSTTNFSPLLIINDRH